MADDLDDFVGRKLSAKPRHNTSFAGQVRTTLAIGIAVDLNTSVTEPGRHLIVQKWFSDEMQQTHFDSELMVEMAHACQGLLASAPDIDLWEATSAHDLR